MHSCPHLPYLNYICNAYRGVVGTEYVGTTSSHMRYDNDDDDDDVGGVRRRCNPRTRVYSSANARLERSRALSATHATHRRQAVCLCIYACVCICMRHRRCASLFPPRSVPVYRIEFRVCELVTTYCATRNLIAYKRRVSAPPPSPAIEIIVRYSNLHSQRITVCKNVLKKRRMHVWR